MMKSTTTLLDEVFPEFVANVFGERQGRDSVRRTARIGEGSA
jgi:hypothetical protein